MIFFMLGRMYFSGNGGCQNFLVVVSMLSFLLLDSNEKGTSWISTRVSSEKIKQLDSNLEPTMSNLSNGRVKLKFNNTVLMQKSSSSLYNNFILNLYMIYELNTLPRNATNIFTLKIVFLVQSN